jgi:hypothetical protein
LAVVTAAAVAIPVGAAAAAPTCGGLAATIIGTSGDDFLVGTSGPDVIVGRGGNDVIEGRGGADIICGGSGNDTLRGNADSDTIFGGKGFDKIAGGTHDDDARGGAGRDRIKGGAGNDILRGQAGKDTIRGGLGSDSGFGGGASDVVIGGAGTDLADGGPKIDSCDAEQIIQCDTPDAYAWANNSTSASYTPSRFYSNNPSGGAITATRLGVGDYRMTFTGHNMGNGTVQATAYGSDARCTVGGWSTVTINVDCYDVTGARVDTRYTVRHTNDTDAAYAWANDPTTASYTPSTIYSNNPGGGAITANRTGVGQYNVVFTGQNVNSGDVQVTAYNSSANCTSAGWGGSTLFVTCYAAGTSTPVDSLYTVLWTADADQAYAWGNDPTAASYTPSSTYSNNPSGGGITITRSGDGAYVVEFTDHTISGNGNVLVTSYSTDGYCGITSWGGDSIGVVCRDAVTGAAEDNYFDVLFDK